MREREQKEGDWYYLSDEENRGMGITYLIMKKNRGIAHLMRKKEKRGITCLMRT